MANQILCIRRSNRMEPHDRITHVGGLNDQGQQWLVSQQEAIQGIESRKWQFHVRIRGRNVPIVVGVSADGQKYLKAATDRLHPNDLLTLPECPQ